MDNYEFIATKINALKEKHPSLRARTDDYVFSVLCVKNHFYKNPALVLNEDDFAEIVVDGSRDGGADILLTDPNSEESDMIIGQLKFYKTISKETVVNAMDKMARFYTDMKAGHYEQFNQRTRSRFLSVDGERGENSKVHFVFYTSAPKKQSINTDDLERTFRRQFTAFEAIEVSILFAEDIKKQIREAEAHKPSVERGKIIIDAKDNYLLYGDDEAVIVNASAFSVKQLYAEHDTSLLSLNLRYHITGGKIDKEIRETIRDNPASFWFKNNGITITCDDFEIDGREVKLTNFSIVNGGQTTYLIYKNQNLIAEHDFWLSCKIIKTVGTTTDEKNAFSLEIAKAANSQKPIKDADLKANAPEQIRFAKAMRSVGVFYQTKRGEEIPKKYHPAYLHTKLDEVGKLCLAAIFQEPCKSRNNPSSVYSPEYYEPIFNSNQAQVAQLCKELLYADDYFTKKFLPKFDRENKDLPDAAARTTFAHIARTICIAFTALAARYHCGNLTDKDVTALTSSPNSPDVYKTLRNLGDMKTLLPIELRIRDAYDAALEKLFALFINIGVRTYKRSKIPATNYFNADRNYYDILSEDWDILKEDIQKIFADV